MRPRLLICSYLQEELVGRLVREVPEVEVVYRPELLPIPQFDCDHVGSARELTPEQLSEWRMHLSQAQIAFEFDWNEPKKWRENSPNLRWVQAAQAGVGARAESYGHGTSQIQITTAAGVHAKPLAEFALAGLLNFVRQLPELERRKNIQQWNTGPSNTLFGKKALVVGAGNIGRETAATLSFMGVHCDGTTRRGKDLGEPFERSMPLQECDLGDYDIVVLACPLTAETRGLYSRQKISAMKPGSFLVNLARGPVLDQDALLDALETGHLGGAVLDVADPEPLPAGHRLWRAPNLVFSPHTAANVSAENSRIVDLLIENLRRYLTGEELINVYDPERGY